MVPQPLTAIASESESVLEVAAAYAQPVAHDANRLMSAMWFALRTLHLPKLDLRWH
jgi:hypothetical protein